MTGIRAALVAHHEVGALREDVDHFALALVAPLGTDHDNTLDFWAEHSISWQEKGPPFGGPIPGPRPRFLCEKLSGAKYPR